MTSSAFYLVSALLRAYCCVSLCFLRLGGLDFLNWFGLAFFYILLMSDISVACVDVFFGLFVLQGDFETCCVTIFIA